MSHVLPDGCVLWNSTNRGVNQWDMEITPEHVVQGMCSYEPVVCGVGPTPKAAIAEAITELRALSAWAREMADKLEKHDGQ